MTFILICMNVCVYIYIYDLYTFIYTYIHIVCVFVCRHVYSHYGCLNVPWLCQGQTHGSAGWLGPGSLEHRLCRQPLHCTSSRLSLKDIKDLKDLKGSKLWLPQLYIYIYIYMCIDVCRDVCVLMCDQKNYIPRLIFNKFIPTPREPPNLNWFPPLSSPFVQKSSGSRVIQESFSSPIPDKRK